MNIKKTAKAFAVAAVVGMSSQVIAATTNNWWDIAFTGATTITALTNDVPDYPGTWSRAAGDESSIQTNGEGNVYLKLDTQGNNVTWTPTLASTTSVVLVDSDIYLVGSDSAPTGFDEDAGNPVQTAVYLKNYINSENVTTSSVLCAYVENEVNANVWVELEGVTMVDTNWYNVKIVVDYSAAVPKAKFIVNDIVMNAAGASTAFEFPIANNSDFSQESAQKVKSVSFRGTGSVDNFVGSQVIVDTAAVLTFDVTTFVTNVEQVVAFAADVGMTVSEGTDFWVTFAEEDGSANYLTVVRVYTNETQFVDLNATYVSPGTWTFDPVTLLSYDSGNQGVKITIPTTGLTVGLVIEAYYGDAPTSGGNPVPNPGTPPVIGPGASVPATAFENILGVDYFVVTFNTTDAVGIRYTLCTSATLVAPTSFTPNADPLATTVSTSSPQEITLKAPTGGATTLFFCIKASQVP